MEFQRFPIRCGRSYRVGTTNRVEPDENLGYLYLSKSLEKKGWYLNWEVDTKQTGVDEVQTWFVPAYEPHTVKIILRKEDKAFVLTTKPPAFFWFPNLDDKFENTVEIYNRLFLTVPRSVQKDRFEPSENETQDQKRLRRENLASNAITNNLNYQPPTNSTLDPYLTQLTKQDILGFATLSLTKLLSSNNLKQTLFSDTNPVNEEIATRLLKHLPTEFDAIKSKTATQKVFQVLNSSYFKSCLQLLELCLKSNRLDDILFLFNFKDPSTSQSVVHLLAAIQDKVDDEIEVELERFFKE